MYTRNGYGVGVTTVGRRQKRTLRVLSWEAVDIDVETRWFSTGTVLGYVVR